MLKSHIANGAVLFGGLLLLLLLLNAEARSHSTSTRRKQPFVLLVFVLMLVLCVSSLPCVCAMLVSIDETKTTLDTVQYVHGFAPRVLTTVNSLGYPILQLNRWGPEQV